MARLKNRTLNHLLLLLIVLTPLFSLGLSNHGLWSADEPRVAEIGREMALSGNWAVPTLNGKPFLEQPPLYYGTLALVFKTLGAASDKAARIPSALFSFGTVLILFFVSNALFGPRVALFSGLVLATSGEFFRVAHWVIVDSALAFLIMAAMGFFITGYFSRSERKKTLCYILLYVACTLAFYAKGFVGIVIPGLGILAFLIMERNFKEIARMRLWLGALIFLVMTLPWFIALWLQAGSEYLKVFFLHNHLQRFLPASMAASISESASGHHHPFYYYIAELPTGFLPWSILLLPGLWHVFSRSGRAAHLDQPARTGALFAKCWFLTGIFFLSIASTKRALYLLPLLAPLSMLLALYMDSTLKAGVIGWAEKVFLWIFDVLLLIIGLALIPAYVYTKNVYPPAVSSAFFGTVLSVSVLVAAISLVGFFSLRRTNLSRYWVSICASVALLLIFVSVAIMPLIDKYKSFVPFCDNITAAVPSDQPLYAYKPDETLRGVVPFYTGRSIIEVREISDDLLAKKEPVYVIIRDKRGEFEKELLATGRLHVLMKQVTGSDRSHVLLSSRPAEGIIMIGDTFGKGKRGDKSFDATGL